MLIDNDEKAARRGIRASAATVLLTAALLLASGPGLAPSPASAAQADLAPGAATPSASRAAGAIVAPEPDVSPLTTGSITAVVRPESTGIAGSIDRRLLMVLMMIGFVGMASASISFWRRSIRDFMQAELKRRGR